jgi:hypothetical protein
MIQDYLASGLPPAIEGGLGVLLVLFGRRLYWFFTGLVGFVLGFTLAHQLIQIGPEWLAPVLALLVGVLAALLAVGFQKIAVGIAGLVAGAYTMLWFAGNQGWESEMWSWLAIAGAGIAGALLTRALFELAVVVLSSLLGATLVLQATGSDFDYSIFVLLLIASVGSIYQLTGDRRRSRTRRRSP